ncbi:MAG: hypothetical protein LBS83_00500, partial [Holosporales bacterium]|jgi:hypothetical protein|nr:hypothetical protein [Holosporales bacterium]
MNNFSGAIQSLQDGLNQTEAPSGPHGKHSTPASSEESSLAGLLQGVNSSISNITSEIPVPQNILNNITGSLAESMNNFSGAIQSLQDGLNQTEAPSGPHGKHSTSASSEESSLLAGLLQGVNSSISNITSEIPVSQNVLSNITGSLAESMNNFSGVIPFLQDGLSQIEALSGSNGKHSTSIVPANLQASFNLISDLTNTAAGLSDQLTKLKSAVSESANGTSYLDGLVNNAQNSIDRLSEIIPNKSDNVNSLIDMIITGAKTLVIAANQSSQQSSQSKEIENLTNSISSGVDALATIAASSDSSGPADLLADIVKKNINKIVSSIPLNEIPEIIDQAKSYYGESNENKGVTNSGGIPGIMKNENDSYQDNEK